MNLDKKKLEKVHGIHSKNTIPKSNSQKNKDKEKMKADDED
ncbi:hypothetical protein [Gracilibacillus sp. YIM 98692]|nr:hypothetical protein [Gracilibacillus sp. YIM 98692]